MYRTILMLTLAALVAAACGSAVTMPSAPPDQPAVGTPSATTSAPAATNPAASAPAATTPSPVAVSPTAVATPPASAMVDPSPPVGTPTGAEAQIQISNFMFEPMVLQVSAGTTVQWTNLDAAGHTVTSGPSDEPDGLFDSGVLAQGDSFAFQFMQPGSYQFYCDLHPRMTGQIEVGP